MSQFRIVCGGSDANDAFIAQNECPLDHVFQLTDVPRPVMGHEKRERFRRDALNGFLLQSIEKVDELFHQ